MSRLTLYQYKESKHKIFTHEFVQVKEKIFTIYKNKGYSGRSKVYGEIFEVTYKNTTSKFKTKKEVVDFIEFL